MHRSKTASLFDHLVGAQEEISTDRKSERSRCFDVDDKLEFGGLLNRQVGRLRALQNLLDVSGGKADVDPRSCDVANRAFATGLHTLVGRSLLSTLNVPA
jgi:hypothetical protein